MIPLLAYEGYLVDSLVAKFFSRDDAIAWIQQKYDHYMRFLVNHRPQGKLWLTDIIDDKVVCSYDLLNNHEHDSVAEFVTAPHDFIATIFRGLTVGERQMIANALNYHADYIEQNSVTTRALDDIINALQRDVAFDVSRRLKAPLVRAEAMRNVASFIARNHVVAHTLVTIPEQA